MQSILSKLRVITLSNLHSLLNAIKELNSIGEFEQYVRDLQQARDMLDDQAAVCRAAVNSLPQEIATLQARYQEADANINILLGDDDPTNDHLAAPLEAKMLNLEREIQSKNAKLAPAREEMAKFDAAVSKLDMTVIEAQGRLTVLRDLDQQATTKAKTERLLAGVSIGDMPDVDNVERKLRERAAVADNALDRTLNRVTEGAGGSTIESEVAARLAKRRAAINAAKANTPA